MTLKKPTAGKQTMADHRNSVSKQEIAGRDKIIAVATKMFANMGFAQVSIRSIAAEVGFTISTVMYHAGSKQKLLEACLDRAFAKESNLVDFLERIDINTINNHAEFFATYDKFVEIVVSQNIASPIDRRLWMRLALDHWPTYQALEAKYVQSIYLNGLKFLNGGREAGWIRASRKEIRIFVSTLDALLNGFLVNGLVSDNGARLEPSNDKQISALKVWLKKYGRRMLT